MGEKINAGVVVVTRFCKPSSSTFAGYINYIDRSEAVRNVKLSRYNLYNDYMGNPEKTTGLFTKDKTDLNMEDKDNLKEVFETARENGSLMWQTVVSFDNRWLEEHGLYDAKRDILDERKVKEVITGAVNKMLKNEGLENAVWSAAIHHNTDNIHVHIATVEPMPCRAMKEYQVYNEKIINGEVKKIPVRNPEGKPLKTKEYVGRFKQKSIDTCKKHVVDEILGQREQNITINKIIREDILKQKAEHVLSTDADLKDKFLEVYKCLPRTGNRGLWNYNNNAMNRVRPMLDELTKAYIQKYNPGNYKLFVDLLTKQSADYKTAYGLNGTRDFKDNKIKELYERMGNQILKEMREYDKRTGGEEYNPEDAERIMEEFQERMQARKEYEAAKEIDNDIFLDIDDLDASNMDMEWSDDYKLARKLLYGKVKDLKKGYELLAKEAKEGNVLAVYEIGNVYQRGIGVEIDPDKANYYYEKALHGFENICEHRMKSDIPQEEKSVPYLQYRIGKMYYHGTGTEKDYTKAFEYLKESADQQNIYASYITGNMYYNGEEVEANKEMAFHYYNKAIKETKRGKSNPYAHYKVAQMYEKGESVEKDEEEAEIHYKIAYQMFEKMEKETPDANTEYKLGMMNLKGKGVEENIEKAEEYLKQSSENGNTYAQYQYAKILIDKGDDENAKKAVEMLRKSALKKNTMSQYALGKLYATDERFYNEAQAIRFLSMAANSNDLAKYELGKMYANTHSKFFDMEKAIKCFTDVAEKGNEYACYNLGKIYMDKENEYYDLDKAIYYLEKASEYDNDYAKYRLGSIYSDRETKHYNPQKAVENLTTVAEKGNVYAQYKLGKLFMDKESKIYDPEKGIHYYKMASEQGNEYADMALGFIYFNGDGVPVDKKQARFYFNNAGMKGNMLAKKMMIRIDNPKALSKPRFPLYRGIKNRGAYEIERALNGLKNAFDDTLKKQKAIRMHEQLLEQERKEKEREEKQTTPEEELEK